MGEEKKDKVEDWEKYDKIKQAGKKEKSMSERGEKSK